MNDFLMLGKHSMCELSECNHDLLQNNDLLEHIYVTAAREHHLSIVQSGRYDFTPHGLTCYLLLEESHSSLHVWPEYDYCAVDLFACNLNLNGTAFFQALQKELGARRALVQSVNRGLKRERAKAPALISLSRDELPEATSTNTPWGWHLVLNLYQCDPETIRSAPTIKRFVRELCDLIHMRRFGDTVVVRFGDAPAVTGYSMFQLIETSNLSGHFAEATNSAYLDIFSCQEFDPNVVLSFCVRVFKAAQAYGRFVLRE